MLSNDFADVYSSSSVLVRRKMARKDIQVALKQGVYIIDKKCVLVK
jgi:hypothetical protein